MAAKKKKSDKAAFHVPEKGKRCERLSKKRPSASDFHKDSFRWVRMPDKGKGPAFVMVGCPKFTRTKTMPRKAALATKWNPAAPLGKQCQFKKGGKAGLVHHKVIQPAKRGACRAGYIKK